MRLLIFFVVLLVGVVYIAIMNPDEHVTIRIWNTELHDVELFKVVLGAGAVGFVVAAVIGLIEGATFRLQNRRLRREIQKLETELNYLRTQPASATLREPDALEAAPPHPRAAIPREAERPSAPVYDAVDLDAAGPEDEDDDAYTGRSAV
jgi:hypothetical protein